MANEKNTIDQIVIAPIPSTSDYAFHIYPSEYKAAQIAVIQIHTGYFFPTYDSENNCYTYILRSDEISIPRTGEIKLQGILYNYNTESLGDIRSGFTDLSMINPIEFVALAPGAANGSSDWRPLGLIVSTIEGPFQDDQLVTEIDLTKKVYYLATPSKQDISDSQILCTKWQYQYNADTIKSFNNSVRSVVTVDGTRKCKMLCEFNNLTTTRTIQIYPFMNERDPKLFNTCPVKGAPALEDTKVCRISLKEIEDLFGIRSKQRVWRQEIIDHLNRYIYDSGKEIHINTKLRKAHFFAQVGVETLGIDQDWIVENDGRYYTAEGIKTTFDAALINNLKSKGVLDTYLAERPQKKFLNYMYANIIGNGDQQSGDGYRYRGRGLIQTTGRNNYRDAAERVKEFFPNDYVDYEANPDILKETKHAVLSGIAYWEKYKMWELADKLTNPTNETFLEIRKKVNKKGKHSNEAKAYFDLGMTIFEEKCSDNALAANSSGTDGETTAANGGWVNPLESCQRTHYNSSGVVKPQNGAFGPVRTGTDLKPKNHQGLDIFAEVGTVCKAALNGEIVSYSNEGNDGYGNVLVLKVKGEDLRKAKRDYTLEFAAEKVSGEGFDLNAEFHYLRYAHLKSAIKKSGTVTAGELIAYSGDSGNAKGVAGPHVHFEVAMKASGNGTGLTNRYNPAFFVRLDKIDVELQTKVKKARVG